MMRLTGMPVVVTALSLKYMSQRVEDTGCCSPSAAVKSGSRLTRRKSGDELSESSSSCAGLDPAAYTELLGVGRHHLIFFPISNQAY